MNIRFTVEQGRFTKLSCTVANKELPLHLDLAALAKPCLYKSSRTLHIQFPATSKGLLATVSAVQTHISQHASFRCH